MEQERRWSRQRYAVPHRVDGPKVTLGTAWFVVLVAAVTVAPFMVASVVVPVVGLAALQTAQAWARVTLSDPQLATGAAVLIAATGLAGNVAWLGAATVVGALALAGYGAATLTGRGDDPARFAEIMVRCSVPVAVAGGCLVSLALDDPALFVALVLMISAYEVGDFLVGSGASNDIEGPAAGLVALAMVGFGVWLLPPQPLTATAVPFFVIVTAVCSPLGQIFGSALLPRGDAAAPALRRLDSYLLAAPAWVLLV